MRHFRLLVLVAVLSLVACDSIMSLFEKHRRPSRYLIPAGYVGWVVIETEVPGAPPRPLEDGFFLNVISPSGRMNTSSPLEYGWATDEYYYVDSTGKRNRLPITGWSKGGMIWAGQSGGREKKGGTPDHAFESFFVGTEAQFKAQEGHGPP